MVVYSSIETLPKFDSSVITIGSFDGLHLGHMQLLKLTTQIAKEKNVNSVVITFNPHPKSVLNQSKIESHYLLLDESKKSEILEKEKIDILVNIPFTKEFSEMNPEDFLKNILVDIFSPTDVVIGFNHHFGKQGQGDYKLLVQQSNTYNYKVHVIDEYSLHSQTISSTEIRNCIFDGDISTANSYLGWDYEISGTVIHGDKRGKKIGFPTANLEPSNPNKLIPANGVYCVQVKLENSLFYGMCNIGVRPTFKNKNNRTIEVHIFDKDNLSIYGEKLTIIFNCQLRKEKKFENEIYLKEQLIKDKENCLEYNRC